MQVSRSWQFELLSWLFVSLFLSLILLPIYIRSGDNYTFYLRNFISILMFLTLTRYIFLLGFTPFARQKWFKFLFIFLPIPLLLFQVDSLYDFQRLLDEEGTISFFKGSSDMSDYDFGKFIRYQYLFFCVGAIVTLILMPIRMIISFWRTTNTKDRV
jgi:hypothetical protein